jgi:hypothetical protein
VVHVLKSNVAYQLDVFPPISLLDMLVNLFDLPAHSVHPYGFFDNHFSIQSWLTRKVTEEIEDTFLTLGVFTELRHYQPGINNVGMLYRVLIQAD